jgi:Icc protein
MKILQITDPHLYGHASAKLRGVETDSTLRNVLDDAFMRGPGLRGDPGDRRSRAGRSGRLFALSQHLRQLPQARSVHSGQSRRAGSDAPRRSRGPPFQYCGTYRAAGWQFIMLDSYDAGHAGGRLSRRSSSASTVRSANRREHAMVCLHHHPVAMGSRWLDGVGLANPDDFWRIIDAHPHVRAVTWGHVHQELRRRARQRALVCHPFDRRAVLAEERAIRRRLSAAGVPPFALHPDGRIETTVRWVDAMQMRHAAAAR